uniref:CRM1_C domain-containing protein n=1 Tax=Mesocestoides corti TaxID=53468 RepID=A0A5K3FZS6_MESCO
YLQAQPVIRCFCKKFVISIANFLLQIRYDLHQAVSLTSDHQSTFHHMRFFMTELVCSLIDDNHVNAQFDKVVLSMCNNMQ